MIDAKTLTPMPNLKDHNCFGCSPANPHGLQMRFLASDKSVVSRLTIPAHLCGWNNVAHGGVVSAILDEIMSRSAVYLLGRVILTRSITVDFLKPTFIGKPVQAEGEIMEQVSEREAIIQGRLYDDQENLCARSRGTFALFTPETIRRLGFMDNALVDKLEKMIQTDKTVSARGEGAAT